VRAATTVAATATRIKSQSGDLDEGVTVLCIHRDPVAFAGVSKLFETRGSGAPTQDTRVVEYVTNCA